MNIELTQLTVQIWLWEHTTILKFLTQQLVAIEVLTNHLGATQRTRVQLHNGFSPPSKIKVYKYIILLNNNFHFYTFSAIVARLSVAVSYNLEWHVHTAYHDKSECLTFFEINFLHVHTISTTNINWTQPALLVTSISWRAFIKADPISQKSMLTWVISLPVISFTNSPRKLYTYIHRDIYISKMCILAHNTQMFVHPCMRVMLKHKKKRQKRMNSQL